MLWYVYFYSKHCQIWFQTPSLRMNFIQFSNVARLNKIRYDMYQYIIEKKNDNQSIAFLLYHILF